LAVRLVGEKITLKLAFGAIQALLSFVAIVLALVLQFDFFNAQTALNIAQETLTFNVTILVLAGIIFSIAGLFLVYDWWEEHA
jgi:heme/copper-type cytochrome/quinol oxidase subunit 2